jgi:hypothetical protein
MKSFNVNDSVKLYTSEQKFTVVVPHNDEQKLLVSWTDPSGKQHSALLPSTLFQKESN